MLAWEARALWEHSDYWAMPVEFTDISVYMPVQAPRGGKISLGVLFDFSNNFQVQYFSRLISKDAVEGQQMHKA